MPEAVEVTTPFADALPPLSDEEFEALKASIAADGGVRDACVMTEDGRLLDGHNRRKIDPECAVAALPGSAGWTAERCLAWIYRNNRGRRKLDPAQKKELRKKEIKLAQELRQQDERLYTQEKLADIFGVGQSLICYWLKGKDAPLATNIKIDNGSQKPDARRKLDDDDRDEVVQLIAEGKSQREVAEKFDVSHTAVQKVLAKELEDRLAAEREEAANPKARLRPEPTPEPAPAPTPLEEDEGPVGIPPLKAPPEVDDLGIPIQPHARAAFDAVPLFDQALAYLMAARKLLNEAAESEGGAYLAGGRMP